MDHKTASPHPDPLFTDLQIRITASVPKTSGQYGATIRPLFRRTQDNTGEAPNEAPNPGHPHALQNVPVVCSLAMRWKQNLGNLSCPPFAEILLLSRGLKSLWDDCGVAASGEG